jgi:uncharacterized damage-inducible protein DinB
MNRAKRSRGRLLELLTFDDITAAEKLALSAPEPWLRGSLAEVPVIARAALHSLELAREDLFRQGESLSDDELKANPSGLPSVSFQLKHIVGSLDRLLTYAEGRELEAEQLAALQREEVPSTRTELFQDLDAALRDADRRIRALADLELDAPRWVGRKRFPTTVGGLLVHIAEHTQRHVGQAITTCKIVVNLREIKT